MDSAKPHSLRHHLARILSGLIAASLLYVLGIGPAAYIGFRYKRSQPVFEKLYDPLVRYVRVTPLELPLISYMLWWEPGAGSSSCGATPKPLIARSDIDQLTTQLLMYQANTSYVPTTEQGLQALIERPTAEPLPPRWRQMLEAPMSDPWNHPYAYRAADDLSGKFELFSLGPDGVESADDIRRDSTK